MKVTATMTKDQLIAALQAISGNPQVRLRQNLRMSIPISYVQLMPDGDYQDSSMQYLGPWRTSEPYVQIQIARDQATMVFV